MNRNKAEGRRVFVTQEGPHDYRSAMDFGELVILSSREINSLPLESSEINRGIVSEIQRKMSDYIPERDFLLLSGSPITMGYVWAEAFRRGPKHLTLKWDSHQRCYSPYVVNAGAITPT